MNPDTTPAPIRRELEDHSQRPITTTKQRYIAQLLDQALNSLSMNRRRYYARLASYQLDPSGDDRDQATLQAIASDQLTWDESTTILSQLRNDYN